MVIATPGVAGSGAAHALPVKPASAAGTAADCAWLNPHLPISKRVALLMKKMTVADEIRMIVGNNSMQPYAGNIAGNPALCIPPLTLEDGPNGVGDGLTGVTNLPSGASLAATFSRQLAYEYGQVIGAEQAGKGSDVDLGPTVNIDRDPRWGREFESLSEDPALAANLGVSEISGIQSERVIAQVKHFDAYNQETNRNTPQDAVIVSKRALHELYLPAFRAASRNGKVGSIMCSYATVNGHYACDDHYLLTDVLRGEWNFDGFVTSDWLALHSISAAQAGSDMEQPLNRFFGPALEKAVTDGTVPRAVLNTMVERILNQMFRFHLFDHPLSGSRSAVVTTPAHQALSTEVAEEGTVLLKNDGRLLPLPTSTHIAVIGPAASAQVTYGGGGSAYVIPSSTVTPLAGIEAVAGSSGITYTRGLPTDAELTPIPAADLSTPYTGMELGGLYSATLTAPQTGTYIIGFTNGCLCYSVASLAINGKTLMNDPGTPPIATYAAAVHLDKGQTYTLTLQGPRSIDGLSAGQLQRVLSATAYQQTMQRMSSAVSKLVWATPATVRADIDRAVKAAKFAKVAVIVVADDTETEGADRPDLRLPSAQNALISAVAKANPHTVVVVQAGAPIAMPWRSEVSAILDTWYPGQTNGTALASVLYGKVDPSGHLPVTFPMTLADAPAANPQRFPGVHGKVHYSEGLLVGYRWYDAQRIQPMFPFGFGLSYTHFRYSDLDLSEHGIDGVTPIEVSARVTNVGHVSGTDVVQIYLGMPAATGEPPRKLIGFRRVTLAPGQSQAVHFTVTPRDEWWWGQGGWTETPGDYFVYVGDSSALANLPLTARYEMKQSIGDRQVTVSAQQTLRPGAGAVVRVSLGAGGNEPLQGVHLSLKAPGGWQVVQLSRKARGDLAPNQVLTEQFSVTPPSGTVTQYVTLYGTADLYHGTCVSTHAGKDEVEARHHCCDDQSRASNPPHLAPLARHPCVRRHGGETVLVGS